MRYLKFSLLGTVFCAMLFNGTGYSMEDISESNSASSSENTQNNNNINVVDNIEIELGDDIDDVNIFVDPSQIFEYSEKLRDRRKKRNRAIEKKIRYQDVYKRYKSLQQILILPRNELSVQNREEYQKYIADNYNNFSKKTREDIDEEYSQYDKTLKKIYHTEHIEKLANNLLRDNLEFMSEYSPRDNINGGSNCLFKAAWSIIFYYAKNNNMNDLLDTLLKLYNSALRKYINIEIYDGNYNTLINNYNNINDVNITMRDEDLLRYIRNNPRNIVLDMGSIMNEFPKTLNISKQSLIKFIRNKYSTEELTMLINSLLKEYISFVSNYNVTMNEKTFSVFCNVWKKIAYYVFLNTNNTISPPLQNRISLLFNKTLPFVFNAKKLDYKFVLKQFVSDYIDSKDIKQLQNIINSIVNR